MASEFEFWQTLARWLDQGDAVAMVTVVSVKGSAPRHLGARMLLRGDGQTAGTVGGGALEHEALQQARAALAGGPPCVVSYDLSRDLGMACGGSAELFVEPLLPPERLYIFGGGHIGLEVAHQAQRLGFAVTIIDERPEYACARRFPGAAAVVQTYDPGGWDGLVFDDRTYCVVATHGHGTDFGVVRALMTLEPGDVIATGTPAGVGSTTGTFLKAGDVMEAEIEGIGVLRTPVKAMA